jgi:hypothetical protein
MTLSFSDKLMKHFVQLRRDNIDSAAKALNAVRRETDENGSPTTIDARVWLVCFVPGIKKQWWHPLVHRTHKHVFAMRPEPDGRWTLFEPWWHRLLTASLSTEQARKFLMWAAAGDMVAVREDIPGKSGQVRGWMTCAGLVSYLLGRSYWVWLPHGLYRLLLRELNARRVNVFALLAVVPAELSAAALAITAVCGSRNLVPPRENRASEAREPSEIPQSLRRNELTVNLTRLPRATNRCAIGCSEANISRASAADATIRREHA